MNSKYVISISALISALLLICVPMVHAASVNDDPSVIKRRVQRSLEGYDLNEQTKYIVDNHFTTAQAMAAYRELLHWGMGQPNDKKLQQDVVAWVREGMAAVFRDSGAGIALPQWEGKGQPISVAYVRSLPQYEQIPDFSDPSTLMWKVEEDSQKLISPRAIGQSLSAKALLLISDQSPEMQKIAPVILASILGEVEMLSERFFLGKELGSAMQDAYVPALLEIDDENGVKVLDNRSQLFSQASLIEGLSYVDELLSKGEITAKLFMGEVHGKGLADWRKQVRDALKVIYDSVTKYHFDEDSGSFASEYLEDKGRGNRIMTVDAAETVRALERYMHLLPEDSEQRAIIKEQIVSQAKFAKEALGKRVIAPRGYLLSNKAVLRSVINRLELPVATMSMMMAVESIVEDGSYRKVTEKMFKATHSAFWAKDTGVYRGAAGFKVSNYGGYLFGLVIEWLRRMETLGLSEHDFKKNADDFIRVVLQEGGLVLCEVPAHGERKSLEEYLEKDVPPLVEKLSTTKRTEQQGPILELLEKAADQDGDRIPGCPFADGRYGNAPVLATQTSVKTPFEKPAPEKDEEGKEIPVRDDYGL